MHTHTNADRGQGENLVKWKKQKVKATKTVTGTPAQTLHLTVKELGEKGHRLERANKVF